MSIAHERDEVYNRVSQLYDLACVWRGAMRQQQVEEAARAVTAYHAMMAQLWKHDWDRNLDPDGELPDELMPPYYLTYWQQRQLS